MPLTDPAAHMCSVLPLVFLVVQTCPTCHFFGGFILSKSSSVISQEFYFLWELWTFQLNGILSKSILNPFCIQSFQILINQRNKMDRNESSKYIYWIFKKKTARYLGKVFPKYLIKMNQFQTTTNHLKSYPCLSIKNFLKYYLFSLT